MNFTEDEQKKIDKLPLVLRMAVDTLLGAIKKILNDECDEGELTDTMATINNNSACRFADCDLVNYEEAARLLGISVTNRTKLKRILDKNGVKQFTMNNQKIGFKRSAIMSLRAKLYTKHTK